MNERVYYSDATRRNAQRQQMIIVMAVASVSLSLGALIALLFAPESGDAIRNEIKDQLDDLLKRGAVVTQDAREEVEERIKSAKR